MASQCFFERNTEFGTLYYHREQMNATEADSFCNQQHQARLAILDSQQKLEDAIKYQPYKHHDTCFRSYYRIGLYSTDQTKFRWIDDRKISFKPTQTMNLDSFRKGFENYASITNGNQRVLRFTDETERQSFLCFKTKTSTLVPADKTTVPAKPTGTSEFTASRPGNFESTSQVDRVARTAELNATLIDSITSVAAQVDRVEPIAKLNTAQVVGITCGATLLAVAVVCLFAYFVRKKWLESPARNMKENMPVQQVGDQTNQAGSAASNLGEEHPYWNIYDDTALGTQNPYDDTAPELEDGYVQVSSTQRNTATYVNLRAGPSSGRRVN